MDSKEMVEELINAVRLAHKCYKDMSGGWFLGAAPESFLQVELAKCLKCDYWVTLEVPVPKLFAVHEAALPEDLPREKGRLDIVCWNRDDGNQAEVLLEVKRSWGHIEIKDDVKRMEKILAVIRSIKFGLVVNLTDSTNQKTVKNRLEGMLSKINTDRPEEVLHADYFADSWENKVWHMGVGCYVIDPPR